MKLPILAKQTLMRSFLMGLVKVVGLAGRITLMRLVGAEGVGLYQIAYSYFGFMQMLITGGTPTALALSAAKKHGTAWPIFKTLALVFLICSGAAAFITYWYAPQIAVLSGNPELQIPIRCLAPAILAVPLLSLLRGYFQGFECFKTIAFSELAEQIVRVFSLLIIVEFLLTRGLPRAIGGGMFGTAAGALTALAILFVCLPLCGPGRRGLSAPVMPRDGVYPELAWVVRTSVAISLTRLLVPASDFLEAILIPNRLQAAGFTSQDATKIYGILTGVAVILVYMPTIVTAALSHTVTMKIAPDWQNGRTEQFYKRTMAAIEVSCLWGCFSGVFLFLYAEPVSAFLFKAPEAAEPIRYLAFIPLVVGLREMTTSILWAQEKNRIPFIGLSTGICFSAIVHYFLIPVPGFNYAGAAIGILALEIVAVMWNIAALKLFRQIFLRVSAILLDFAFLAFLLWMASKAFGFALVSTASGPVWTGLKMLFFISAAGLYISVRYLHRSKSFRIR